MSNLTGKFLSRWQMAEAKRSEAVINSVQKRNGTRHPLGPIIAWSCGCCIGPYRKTDKTIATPDEADAILRKKRVEP